ncbi:MAG TPA: GFA family protein [Polyangia bacterium]
MTNFKSYSGSCHCGAVRFRFRSEEITSGCRCNCSICIRKGAVMSAKYIPAGDFEELQGADALTVYRFGDQDLDHCFCKICGISPFSVVARVPDSYDGPAKPGHRRVNLGCVDGVDPLGLTVTVLDGRSL